MFLKGHEDCRRYLYFEGGPRFRPCLRINGRRTTTRLSFSLYLSAYFQGKARVRKANRRKGSKGRHTVAIKQEDLILCLEFDRKSNLFWRTYIESVNEFNDPFLITCKVFRW